MNTDAASILCPCCSEHPAVARGNGFEDCCDVCLVLDFMCNVESMDADGLVFLVDMLGSEKGTRVWEGRRALTGEAVQRFARPEVGDVTVRAMIAEWLG